MEKNAKKGVGWLPLELGSSPHPGRDDTNLHNRPIVKSSSIVRDNLANRYVRRRASQGWMPPVFGPRRLGTKPSAQGRGTTLVQVDSCDKCRSSADIFEIAQKLVQAGRKVHQTRKA